MKKKRIITETTILILMSITLVHAVSFSPSSLIFNLNPNEQSCQTINFDSNSSIISVSDKWAENKDVEWKVSNFETPASSLGISIDYPSNVSAQDKQVKVCLSGSSIGEYHGVLLLKEEQQGNSIVQMGIWLKVIIEEKLEQTQQASTTSGSSSSSGGGSGITGGAITGSTAQSSQGDSSGNSTTGETTQSSKKDTTQNSPLTGSVIGVLGGKGVIVVIFALVIAIAGLVFYIRRNRWKRYY